MKCSKCGRTAEGIYYYDSGGVYCFCERHQSDIESCPDRPCKVDDFVRNKKKWTEDNIRLAKERRLRAGFIWK